MVYVLAVMDEQPRPLCENSDPFWVKKRPPLTGKTTPGGRSISKLGLLHKRKDLPLGGLFFWYGIGDRSRTHLNATVRWTVPFRRLDGGNTIIFARWAKMQIESYIVHKTNPIHSDGVRFISPQRSDSSRRDSARRRCGISGNRLYIRSS